jgi:hypothetical protein
MVLAEAAMASESLKSRRFNDLDAIFLLVGQFFWVLFLVSAGFFMGMGFSFLTRIFESSVFYTTYVH